MNVSSTLSNRPVYDLVNETDDGGVFIFLIYLLLFKAKFIKVRIFQTVAPTPNF